MIQGYLYIYDYIFASYQCDTLWHESFINMQYFNIHNLFIIRVPVLLSGGVLFFWKHIRTCYFSCYCCLFCVFFFFFIIFVFWEYLVFCVALTVRLTLIALVLVSSNFFSTIYFYVVTLIRYDIISSYWTCQRLITNQTRLLYK